MDAAVLYAGGTTVVLDQTVFYPTSGGQLHDTGVLRGPHATEQIVNVYKQGKYVVHVTAAPTQLKAGEKVQGEIDLLRRIQLAQHHTAAHIINGAAREVLGEHIWQAGAAKTVEKGRLDITHYEALTANEMKRIEAVANRVISENKPVVKLEMAKNAAEARYGFRLYQGGAVPGSVIRVITIDGFDTEACGGTHLHTTGEAKQIKLLRSTKVQDGVLRVEYVAGAAAETLIAADQAVLRELETLFSVPRHYLPGRCSELFALWKRAGKAKKDGAPLSVDEKKLHSTEDFHATDGDVIAACAVALGTNKEHVVKTAKRFWDEVHA
jgi:alanyl-tRNA synthetase